MLRAVRIPTPACSCWSSPGRSMKTRALVSNSALNGHFVTLSLSHDAGTVYFAFADPAGQPELRSRTIAPVPAEPGVKYHSFHIMAMDADGSQLRQLTDGPRDDFDPCPLPDGGIAFMSTRRGGKNRCGGGNPEAIYTLHRMDADGANIRTLSFHETNEWHPSVLNDGRIVYTRWDYVDRYAAYFHGLWTCNPDGSNPAVLFGNYTTLPWACYQAKAVPGSSRILFVAGAHHALVGGTLVHARPGARRPGSAERRGPSRGARVPHPRGLLSRGARLAQELLLQPLAAVGELLPGGLQPRSAAAASTRGNPRKGRPGSTTSTASATWSCSSAARASRRPIRSRWPRARAPPVIPGTGRRAVSETRASSCSPT